MTRIVGSRENEINEGWRKQQGRMGGGRWSREEETEIGQRATLGSPFRPCVSLCVSSKGPWRSYREAEFSKAYCGRSKKEVIVFSLNLCLYKYKCIHMYMSPFSVSDYAFK